MPKNVLPRLQRLAATPGCSTIAWERATGPTSTRLGVTAAEATRIILGSVAQLAPADFVESVLLGSCWFDVYALCRDGLGWYIKVGENDNGVVVVSHHAPEKGPVHTQAGHDVDQHCP